MSKIPFSETLLLLLVVCGSAFAECVPTATPDPVAVKAAQAEIAAIQPFLTEPLCEQIAVKYDLASDYAVAGDLTKTLSLAKEIAEADVGFDFPLDGAFKPLADCKGFKLIAKPVHARHPPVHHSIFAFRIDDRMLIPEGLAYDERSGSFLMGSLNKKKIIRFSKAGNVSDFIQPQQDGISEVLGIRMELRDGTVWVASGEDSEQAALFHFSAEGQLIKKYPPPADGKPDHLFNDLVVCRDGDVFLTDSTARQVYTLPHGQAALVAVQTPRPLFYPNGIALSADDKHVFIADAFGVLVLERTTQTIRPVEGGPHVTLSGFDGMYTWRDCLVGIQNSMGSPRVVVIRLDPTRTRAIGLKVLEYRSRFAKLPTTGTIVGDTLYYMTNSQVDHYRDGKIVNPDKLVPIDVARVDLVEAP